MTRLTRMVFSVAMSVIALALVLGASLFIGYQVHELLHLIREIP